MLWVFVCVCFQQGALMCALALSSLTQGKLNIFTTLTCLRGYQVMFISCPLSSGSGWHCKDWGESSDRWPVYISHCKRLTILTTQLFLKDTLICMTSGSNSSEKCFGSNPRSSYKFPLKSRKTFNCYGGLTGTTFCSHGTVLWIIHSYSLLLVILLNNAASFNSMLAE